MSDRCSVVDIRNLIIETSNPRTSQRLVDAVSFSVAKGEVVGLIGESGAGKSTIGLAALGYARNGCRVVSGSVSFEGQDILKISEESRRRLRGSRIAYVAQSASASLNPRMTLLDQCIEPLLRNGRIKRREATVAARNLFRRLRLPNPDQVGERYPHELSGGQLQRVMTAMAMLPRPELIVFDEPTTALDVTTQVEVLLAIRQLIREFGTSAIYISHDLAVVMQLADRIIILRNGAIVEEGETRQLISTPQTEYARALLNVDNFARQSVMHPTQHEILLRADNLSAAYGSKRVLENVSFSVATGETLAIVGESGSGKSTLAKVLSGLLPAESGVLSWKSGTLSSALSDRTRAQVRGLQLIHQSPDNSLNPMHSVRQIIERPLALFCGLGAAQRALRARELLSLVDLDPDRLLARPSSTLSGGQKQRLCIARALAAEPELLICDEVTSALDPLVADGIIRLLERLRLERRLSYVFITHDLGIVRSLADNVVIMHDGRVVEAATVKQIFTPPHAEYTERLILATPQKRVGWLDEVAAETLAE